MKKIDWINTTNSYGFIARLFHWVTGIIVMALLAVGFWMDSLPNSPFKGQVYGAHKAIGLTVLGLVVLRVISKFFQPAPLTLSFAPLWQWAGRLTHGILYLLMILMPVTGYIMSTAAGRTISFFDLFNFPTFIAPNPLLASWARQAHDLLAWGFVILIILHIIAALIHHFYWKDQVLRRMLGQQPL